MKTYARFDEILMGYFLIGFSILDVKFANLSPLWRHLYGRNDRRPPKKVSDNNKCKTLWISIGGVFFQMDFKF